MTVCIR